MQQQKIQSNTQVMGGTG